MNSLSAENIEVFATDGNCVSPLGCNLESNMDRLLKGDIAIKKLNDKQFDDNSFYGAIINDSELNTSFSQLNYQGEFSKLEKMLLLALSPIVEKHHSRLNKKCGFILSSTKGNIDQINTDIQAYFLHNLANNISKAIDLEEKPIVLSNACVSGVMAVSVAKRLIQTGVYDHVVLVAGDIFSTFVYSGFQSFQAISPEPCRPYSKHRDGISLGEAAAAMFITKEKSIADNSGFKISGDSSINDANHISGPSRTGEGLFRSVENALNDSNIKSNDIDCISSHGTATPFNDEMEAQAFSRANLTKTPVFSLKGCFGHTLGAAGLLETVITLDAAQNGVLLPSYGFDEMGITIPLNITREIQKQSINTVLKTASGFGGSNTAVIFEKIKSNG
ncbi:MAG: beta-ketoacyl synthase N-terminal-like domain-containing protein [Brumimicrobium sp.]